MRTGVLWLALAAGSLLYGARTTAAGAPPAAAGAAAARAFLDGLDEAQRQRALLPFDHAARRDWHFFPKERAGLPLLVVQRARRTTCCAAA